MAKNQEAGLLGRRIRERRRRLGFTQEKLGERAGMHYSYIGQVERGEKTPSLRALSKLAEALDLGLENLLESGSAYRTSRGQEPPLQALLKLLQDRPAEDALLILEITRTILDRLDRI